MSQRLKRTKAGYKNLKEPNLGGQKRGDQI